VSAFNFGRFGLDVDNERGVTRLNQSGDESSFDLVVKGVDRDAWRALAQQVTALAGVQPVAWTTEPWVDGWYEVRSVRCDLEVDLRHSQAFRAQINARRLPHHQALDIEATLTGAARTNTPGGVTANYYYCVPNDATTLNYGHGSLTTDTRTGPGGTARVIGGTALSGRYVRWTCTPGDYFAMAPKVQFDGVTVIGRRDHRPALGLDRQRPDQGRSGHRRQHPALHGPGEHQRELGHSRSRRPRSVGRHLRPDPDGPRQLHRRPRRA